ncbi:MAG: hypothetical protein M5R40_13995 [Anaerolineae bacterium]|nr:hypothetical protein [Anaerolineae bacterium]
MIVVAEDGDAPIPPPEARERLRDGRAHWRGEARDEIAGRDRQVWLQVEGDVDHVPQARGRHPVAEVDVADLRDGVAVEGRREAGYREGHARHVEPLRLHPCGVERAAERRAAQAERAQRRGAQEPAP